MNYLLALVSLLCLLNPAWAQDAPRRPNVVLIITDDQGYGDLGCHGNPKIRTPHLDGLSRQGTELESFYVCPVCAPTRASVLTGLYNYRTGVVDTYLGRALMHSDEVTLAEMLAGVGYRTGIFGKWHLGDNYPLRAMDQGFQESLVLKGGGIGQPSDPPGGSSYFDPVLLHNGKLTKTTGYCSDVFTDAAIRFMEQHRDRPFFTYLAFNAPHAPLEVPDRYEQLYKAMNLTVADFPKLGQPILGKFDPDTTAKVYGMVTNIDDNVGRLLTKLDDLKLTNDTIVIFLTDNGPQHVRYTSGLRGRKGTVYDGGIRVPCFLRWPGKFAAGRKIDRIAAHIDIVPTLLDACGVRPPVGVALDGISLLPLLKGDKAPWPDRTLYFQWHRGEVPELFRACAARSQQWKLVQARSGGDKPVFELFDMTTDPFELHDQAGKHPDIVQRLHKTYEAWFLDVSGTRGYAPPRILLGSPQENPTILTRQDWRGPNAGWTPNSVGHWEVEVAAAGDFDITLHFAAAGKDGGSADFRLANHALNQPVAAGATSCTFGPVRLAKGPGQLSGWVDAGRESGGIRYLEVKRRD